MRPLKIILFTLMLLLGLAGTGNALDIFNWGGTYLLSLIQANLNGKITVQKISGNLLTGITYEGLVITGPDGEVFLQADKAVFRLSLWSIPELHLEIADLGLAGPHIYLERDTAGNWNYRKLLKPTRMTRIEKFILQEVNFDDLWVEKGDIVISAAGTTTHYPDLALKSNLTLFHLGEPNQSISINRAELGIETPQGRAEMRTRLTYATGLAKIAYLNLQLAGKTILAVKGQLCLPLGELTCKLTGKVGPVPGSLIHDFWSRWPALWDLAGTFSLTATPEGANIQGQGQIGQADFQVKGFLNAKDQPTLFELDANLEGLSTAQLKDVQGLNPKYIEGLSPVKAHLRLQGQGQPWSPTYVDGRLEVDHFQYREIKVGKLELGMTGSAASQNLHGYVEGNFGTVDLTSSGHLLPLGKDQGLHGELTVQTDDFKPAILGIIQLAGTNLNTRFTGNFRLPPGMSPSQLYLAGDLTANGRVANEPLKDMESSFVLEGRKLVIADANFQALGIAASLKGTVTESGLDVTFVASTSGSRALPLPAGSSFSYLQAQGSVRGPWQSPQINVVGRANNASYNGVSLQAATMTANLSGLPPQSGVVELSGTQFHIKAGDFSRVNLQARGAGGQWQFQAAATSPDYPRLEMAGTADLKLRPMAIHFSKVSWKSQTLAVKNQAPFEVRLSPGFEILPATFQVDGGIVLVQLASQGQQLSGGIQIKGVNAGLFAPLGVPATGVVNGNLSLAGTPAAPLIQGQVALSNGQVRGIPIQTLTTTLNYQPDQMQVAGYLRAGPQDSRLVWNGTVPVAISLSPFKFALANQGLDLRVQSQNINLSLLTILTDQIQSANGQVDALVEARGNPHQPTVSGYVRWSAGAIQPRQAGAPYQLAAGEIRLQGDRITIPGIVLTSQGTARFSGEITLAGTVEVGAQARFDNFLVLYRGGNDLWASGTVNLSGPLSALVVTGRLTVPKADFRPTFFQSEQDPDIVLVHHQRKGKKAGGGPPGLYKNMAINVTADAPGNIWLKDPLGKAELTAHITVTKKPGQDLALGGKISALQGTLSIEGNEFKAERAVITLPGVPNEPPLLDAKATHKVEDADINIIVVANGTLTNPQIHLESQPPLPPTDVLSYLVFGAPAATLTKEQYLTFAAQYGLLGGAGGTKLGQIVGSTIPFLSGIKVKTGLVSGKPTVGVEKEVVKNVSVFVGRKLNEERGTYEQQVGLQYKVNKHITLESQKGTRSTGADVLFNYDW